MKVNVCVQMKSMHSLLGGTILFPLAMTSMFLATNSGWFVALVPVVYMRYAAASVPVVMAIAVFVKTRARFVSSSKTQD